MKNYELILLYGALLIYSVGIYAQNTKTLLKPSRTYTMCDDMGYGCFGCYAHPFLNTPDLYSATREAETYTRGTISVPLRTDQHLGHEAVHDNEKKDSTRVRIHPNGLIYTFRDFIGVIK